MAPVTCNVSNTARLTTTNAQRLTDTLKAIVDAGQFGDSRRKNLGNMNDWDRAAGGVLSRALAQNVGAPDFTRALLASLKNTQNHGPRNSGDLLEYVVGGAEPTPALTAALNKLRSTGELTDADIRAYMDGAHGEEWTKLGAALNPAVLPEKRWGWLSL